MIKNKKPTKSERDIAVAIALLQRKGYRVTKERPKKEPVTKGNGNGLNSIGRPYSASFDPNYRMKHKPSYAHLYKPGKSIGPGVSPERWTELCAMAKAHWDFSREHGTPLPMHTDAPVPQGLKPQGSNDDERARRRSN